MEVNLNSGVSAITSKYVSQSKETRTERSDEASFSGAEALEEDLARTPSLRPEVLERARHLVADIHYPPQETIIKIASLLAIELSKSH